MKKLLMKILLSGIILFMAVQNAIAQDSGNPNDDKHPKTNLLINGTALVLDGGDLPNFEDQVYYFKDIPINLGRMQTRNSDFLVCEHGYINLSTGDFSFKIEGASLTFSGDKISVFMENPNEELTKKIAKKIGEILEISVNYLYFDKKTNSFVYLYTPEICIPKITNEK